MTELINLTEALGTLEELSTDGLEPTYLALYDAIMNGGTEAAWTTLGSVYESAGGRVAEYAAVVIKMGRCEHENLAVEIPEPDVGLFKPYALCNDCGMESVDGDAYTVIMEDGTSIQDGSP